MMNARKQFTGIIVYLTAYLRNEKSVLNLKKVLYAMIVSTGYTITSWLRSSIDPIIMSTAYYSVASFERCELEFANAAACLINHLKALDLWRQVYFVTGFTPSTIGGVGYVAIPP